MTSPPFLGQTATIWRFRAHNETVVSEPVEQWMRKPNTGICNAAVIIRVCVCAYFSIFIHKFKKKKKQAREALSWVGWGWVGQPSPLCDRTPACVLWVVERKAGRWEVDLCSFVSTRGLWWGVFAAQWSGDDVKCQNPKAESTAAVWFVCDWLLISQGQRGSKWDKRWEGLCTDGSYSISSHTNWTWGGWTEVAEMWTIPV